MIQFVASASGLISPPRVYPKRAPHLRIGGSGWREQAFLRLPTGQTVPVPVVDALNWGRGGAEALPAGAVGWTCDVPFSMRAWLDRAFRDERGAFTFLGSNTFSAISAGFPSSITLSCNLSGADVVWIGGFQNTNGGGASVNSATYNSVSLTSDASLNASGGNARGFYLAAPASGTNNAVVNLTTGSAAMGALILLCYSGCDQTTPIRAAGITNSGNGTDGTFTQTGTSGDMLVGAFIISTGGFHTVTAGTNTTLRINNQNTNHRVGMDEAATGGSQTMNATWTTTDGWWGTASQLKAAAAGATAFPHHYYAQQRG